MKKVNKKKGPLLKDETILEKMEKSGREILNVIHRNQESKQENISLIFRQAGVLLKIYEALIQLIKILSPYNQTSSNINFQKVLMGKTSFTMVFLNPNKMKIVYIYWKIS